MHLSLIVAMTRERVIGREGALPWRLPADLKHFKALTMGKPILMGRRTFESIGRPLPGRRNLILSTRPSYAIEGCVVVSSLEAALAELDDCEECMVVGGAKVYEATLKRADRLYITWVEADCQGDTCFPRFEESHWREVAHEAHEADAKNEYAYTFVTLERVLS